MTVFYLLCNNYPESQVRTWGSHPDGLPSHSAESPRPEPGGPDIFDRRYLGFWGVSPPLGFPQHDRLAAEELSTFT